MTILSFNRMINALLRGYKIPVQATYLDGTSVEVSLSDHDGRVLYLFGTNDPKVSHACRKLLRPGDVFLDIGANYASIGFEASHAVGTAGMVHLFEPQKVIGERVQIAIQSAGYQNVELHRIGLMDKDGSFTLTSPANHSGMGTFIERNDSDQWPNRETCEVRNIAIYLPPLIRGQCFGVKIDVEGAEPKIMPWLLAQANLRFVVFEAAHNRRNLYDEVNAAGMRLFGLQRHPFRVLMVRVDSYAQMLKYHDMVALRVPPGKSAPRRIGPDALARGLWG